MKRSGTTITFVLVCVAVLLGSYGVGLGIREIRFKNTGTQTQAEKPTNQIQTAPRRATPTTPSLEVGQADSTIFGEGRNRGGAEEEGMGRSRRRGGGDFGNLTEEERAQMPERTGRRSRRGGMDFENLSEEDRAAMEERRQQMMERLQNMTEEERAQFRGGRGGRGGRSRGEMFDPESGGNDFQSDENNVGQEDNNIE